MAARSRCTCSGRGVHTVLLDAGGGGRREHMAALFAALAKRYRVCDDDRRNIGRSPHAAVPRKAAELSAELFDALAAAHVDGPYILFGTSMGGLLVRAHAASHPVSGFVTSNQPGTTREWTRAADPVMSSAQRADDAAWLAGANIEHIDVNDISCTIDGAPPLSVPYVIMISAEHAQCAAAGLADRCMAPSSRHRERPPMPARLVGCAWSMEPRSLRDPSPPGDRGDPRGCVGRCRRALAGLADTVGMAQRPALPCTRPMPPSDARNTAARGRRGWPASR